MKRTRSGTLDLRCSKCGAGVALPQVTPGIYSIKGATGWTYNDAGTFEWLCPECRAVGATS